MRNFLQAGLERFPRIVFCKLDLQTLYDFQKHWVQCILPENIFLEKTFLIIIYWLCFVFILNFLSIIFYLRFIFNYFRKSYICSRLEQEDQDVDGEALSKFMSLDSVLAIRLLNSNTYNFKVSSILKSLYVLTRKTN